MSTSPLTRLRQNATEIVSVLVTGVWLTALLTSQDWWLGALLLGYVVVIPITDMLFGTDEETEDDLPEREDSLSEQSTHSTAAQTGSDRDALQTLRDRYARGELTDEQFDRKLEVLLETETLEDIEDRSREKERA
ncbi:SHOCT domain-containing protein [Haloferax larsenii]|uniref:SHOCT domain-containing protein n=1 Tax=Haloferax larsenii TaxID=302484 RepID=A0ABY5RHE4_HALLR|nr:SHOCT domain-containing protein [Haloferax larsenii]ELZ75442.1 hypothetical protein C455_15653 [Haloferax larsenii JCM 13917]UVE51460.1 SHOCT domain-containing protein [Haloferax larsenii]